MNSSNSPKSTHFHPTLTHFFQIQPQSTTDAPGHPKSPKYTVNPYIHNPHLYPFVSLSPVRFRVFSMDPNLQPNPEPVLVTITVRAL